MHNVVLVHEVLHLEEEISKQGNQWRRLREDQDSAVDDLSVGNLVAHIKVPCVLVGTELQDEVIFFNLFWCSDSFLDASQK